MKDGKKTKITYSNRRKTAKPCNDYSRPEEPCHIKKMKTSSGKAVIFRLEMMITLNMVYLILTFSFDISTYLKYKSEHFIKTRYIFITPNLL